MKKISAWFLMVLILSIGVITLGGCSKDSVDSEDEDNLGASRPNPSMLPDLSLPGARINWTFWQGDSFTYSMTLEFNYDVCTYTHKRDGLEDVVIKYSHNFKYPTITLTPHDEDKEVIIGTVISYRFKVEDITFKNTKNETVWMKMTRKK